MSGTRARAAAIAAAACLVLVPFHLRLLDGGTTCGAARDGDASLGCLGLALTGVSVATLALAGVLVALATEPPRSARSNRGVGVAALVSVPAIVATGMAGGTAGTAPTQGIGALLLVGHVFTAAVSSPWWAGSVAGANGRSSPRLAAGLLLAASAGLVTAQAFAFLAFEGARSIVAALAAIPFSALLAAALTTVVRGIPAGDAHAR